MADNGAVIRRMFEEVVNQGRLDVIDEVFDPEFQTATQQGLLDLDGFRMFLAAWRAGFDDIHCEVGDVVSEGDRVAWSVRATGTHTGDFMGIPATGNRVDFGSLNTAQLRDGRLYRHQVLMDLGALMVQLGVGSPAPAGVPA